ncbi:hypothetical protein [Brevibacillus laterosporus]|uniref:hypothetical protein n=1 Tax=Brevibacillus laterosporus TaxID=1465 RepID=UPI003D1FE8D6
MEYQGEVSKLTGKIQLVSEDISNPTYFTPQLANESFLKRIANTEAACLTNTEHIERAIEKNGELDKIKSDVISLNTRVSNDQANILGIAIDLEMLKGALLNNVSANIYIETLDNKDDINLMNGIHDPVAEKIVLR